jgi:hypothetical protein
METQKTRYLWAAAKDGDIALGVVLAPKPAVAFAAALDNAADYHSCESDEGAFAGFVVVEDLGDFSISPPIDPEETD